MLGFIYSSPAYCSTLIDREQFKIELITEPSLLQFEQVRKFLKSSCHREKVLLIGSFDLLREASEKIQGLDKCKIALFDVLPVIKALKAFLIVSDAEIITWRKKAFNFETVNAELQSTSKGLDKTMLSTDVGDGGRLRKLYEKAAFEAQNAFKRMYHNYKKDACKMMIEDVDLSRYKNLLQLRSITALEEYAVQNRSLIKATWEEHLSGIKLGKACRQQGANVEDMYFFKEQIEGGKK